MSIITTMCKQKAVLWKKGNTKYDSHGNVLFDEPREIDVRWEDVQEVFVDAQGAEQMSHAKVFVLEDLSPEDILMLGTLDDVENNDEPKENPNAWEIRGWNKIPNLKQTEYVRICYL